MDETIDVLLATYNGEKYLAEQMDSILNQTYTNINLIISDDCSTDKTREILEHYKQKDDRVSVYYQEKNLGYVKNFEFLLRKVEHNFYMLSDQDDVWLPEKIEKSFNKLKKENADLVFTDLEVVDENLNTIHHSFNELMLLDKKIKKYINTYKLNYLYNCITGCTIMSKRKFIEKILPFPVDSKYMIHDYWIGLVISLNGKLIYIPEKYIKYRQHGNNQIGIEKESHGYKQFNQVRNLFIDVKIGIFKTYVNNKQVFTYEIQNINKNAYDYFLEIRDKKNFNFKKWRVFHELYKTESIKYYIANFAIMNLPFFCRPVYKIRYLVLKLLGKR